MELRGRPFIIKDKVIKSLIKEGHEVMYSERDDVLTLKDKVGRTKLQVGEVL